MRSSHQPHHNNSRGLKNPRRIHSCLRAIGIALVIVACGAVPRTGSRVQQRSTVDSLFSFHSNMWFNMHHFLYERARIHHGLDDSSSPALAAARSDTAGYANLSPTERATWDDAVLYYDTAFVAHHLDFDSGRLIGINYLLADNEDRDTLSPTPNFPTALASLLNSAAVAYRKVWWPRHNAANEQWVNSMMPLLHDHAPRVMAELQRIYEVRWPGSPIRAEVVAYANWAGAYTTIDPTLVTISSTYRGNQASFGLEMLFHEPQHAMLDSVNAVLKELGVNPHSQFGGTLEHAIIFYTAGELTRREIPSHVPFAEVRGLWNSGAYLGGLHAPLVAAWLPRIHDQTTLRAALTAVVARVSRPANN